MGDLHHVMDPWEAQPFQRTNQEDNSYFQGFEKYDDSWKLT